MENELLKDLVVIFAVAVVIVGLLKRVGIPSIAGFIFAGIFVGPNVLGIVDAVHDVEVLAEVGVALLLFGIGLELSLDRVRRLWKLVVTGGALQVVVTGALTVAVLLRVGLETPVAVLFGCVVAVSSTAIVLSALRARGETDGPHGRLTLGILIFQDLSVVPMILVIPLLSGNVQPVEVAITLGKAAAVLAAVLFGARLVVPRLLRLVAYTRQRELFILSVFLICIGTAWLVSAAGVSLALGAFLAGLVVAGSEFRHQALSDLIPFREVFASIFFVSVGMLLDPMVIFANLVPILIMVVVIVAGKALIATIAGLVARLPLRVSILAGLALAQVGEFSFVLLSAGRDAMVLPQPFTDTLTAAIVVTMLITPLIIMAGPHVAAGVVSIPVLTRRLGVRAASERPTGSDSMSNHVIIAGYGLTGQDLANSLKQCGVNHVIVDINPENVRRASSNQKPAYFGDVTSEDVLEAMGVKHAVELVLSINDLDATIRTIGAARRLAPDLNILVRIQYAADINRLIRAGATEIVAAELEASAVITQRVLAKCRVEEEAIAPQMERIRERTQDQDGSTPL
jgi:CPA2 family monovalent cation:H+ antiporter-2